MPPYADLRAPGAHTYPIDTHLRRVADCAVAPRTLCRQLTRVFTPPHKLHTNLGPRLTRRAPCRRMERMPFPNRPPADPSPVARAWLLATMLLHACSTVDQSALQAPDVVDAGSNGGAGDGDGDGDGDTGGKGGGGGPATGGLPGDGAPDASVTGCFVDPDGDACDESCVETCNGHDDDCDGEIDEDADAMCLAANGEAICVAGACIVTDCDDGYRDCDGAVDNGCEASLASIEHCGACRNACSFDRALPACVAGECEPAGCVDDFLDCNASPAVCETPSGTLNNCLGCGDSCGMLDNATTACGAGGCGVEECIGNYGDCNGLGQDGCERELTELDNCAGCGTACSFVGSGADCGTGVCLATECETGYADCDGDPSNGCESLDSAAHCGACGQQCEAGALQNVTMASCEAGSCQSECSPGFADCDGEPNGCETATTTTGNCGGCGVTCAPANATGECGGGSCGVAVCADGWADCDGLVDNGCETNLGVPATCGGCETACEPMVGCAMGECRGITCPEGQADCDGVDSCDFDLSTDATCGACNVRCAFDQGVDGHGGVGCAVTDATPGQRAWACELSCDDGHADCDGDYRNGCETDLTTLDNCGGCGSVCAKQHATPTCDSGVCEVERCDEDYGDCDGDRLSCERRLNTTSNCGACDAACNLANAQNACTGTAGARACGIAACNPAFYADCDDSTATGCEIDTRTDARHCNGCGRDCTALPRVMAASCSASACVFDQCEPGYADCNDGAGCESDLTANDSCGGCGVNCAGLPNTQSATCGGAPGAPACEVVACDPGYGDCGAAPGCETRTDNDALHCGACAGDAGHQACTDLPNVTQSTCAMGECRVAQCDDGFEDCNGDASDGCEWNPDQDGRCCDPNADADGDGFDDCADECHLDAARALAGECGCPSSPAPAGQACNDGLCAANVACDGLGQCGSPGECDAPGGSCSYHTYAGAQSSGYWFCTNNISWTAARDACAGIEGGALITIEDGAENAFANAQRDNQAWIGANDRSTEDQWRWSASGEQFWQGDGSGSGGARVMGRYANWEGSGEPSGNGDCGYLWQDSGTWDDTSCGDTKDYICEVAADLCPDDPKVAPGVCGCAEADVDTDGDGVLDCNDECPLDDARISAGQCGCPSAPTMLGAACDDGVCAANVACDGAGQCGTVAECIELPTLALGREHACAVSDGGRVVCWGDDSSGQLGDGESSDYQRGGSHVAGLYDAVQVATAMQGTHSCALRANGQVVCWGENGDGQLGDDSTTDRSKPVTVGGIQDALMVSAGSTFSCALLQSGEVRCWGDGNDGRLGRDSTTDSRTPIAVLAGEAGNGNLTGAVYLSSGERHTCAVLADGKAVCWGEGIDGQCGNDDNGEARTPVYVHGVDNAGTCTAGDTSGCLSNVLQVSAGANTTLAIHDGGLVSSFGSDTYGENGRDGGGAEDFPIRVSAPGGGTLDDARWVAMGDNHGCAVRQAGEALCWGEDLYGRLGDDGLAGNNPEAPFPVSGPVDYTEVATGQWFSCGRRADASVSCWGANNQGQVGDGTTTNRDVPTPVAGAAEGFVELDTGSRASCGVTANGLVYCWGEGNNGELAQGSNTAEYRAPIRVAGIDNASDVVVLDDSACALLDDGQIKCWGYNVYGRLGDATGTQRTTPVNVLSGLFAAVFTGATEIAGGHSHMCALRGADGTVWCWGLGADGRVGDNTGAHRSVASPVWGINDATAIGAGYHHSCAIRGAAGEAWCWGYDGLGQLGDDNLAVSKWLPVKVQGGQTGFAGGRQTIDGAEGNTCAVKDNGEVWCWGYNVYGNNGDADTNGTDWAPVKVESASDDFVRVALGGAVSSGTCALRANGEVFCWGNNNQGELGVGSSTGVFSSPVQVDHAAAATGWGNTDLLSPAVDVSVGPDHAMAAHANGAASAWGTGGSGRLGTGDSAERTLPTQVCAPPR